VVLAGGGTAAWLLEVALADAPAGRLVVLPTTALLVALVGVAAAPVAAALTATVVWACLLGFDENRYGVLTWHPGDGWRLALLVVTAVLCSLLRTQGKRRAPEPSRARVLARFPRPRVPASRWSNSTL
jgi:hypothetical protein